MQWYHYLMGGLFALAFILSFKTPRAWLWLAALLGSYVGSILYLRQYEHLEAANALIARWPTAIREWVPLEAKWLPPSAIAAMLDLSVALAIHRFARERWEAFYLFNIVLLMLLANLLFFTGTVLGFPPLPSQEILGIGLEAINIAALLLIGGTGIHDLLGAANGHHYSRGPVAWFLETGRSLHAPYRHKFWGR